MQATMELSQEQFFDLFDLAETGFVILSEQGVILEANHTAAAWFGAGNDDLTGQAFIRFVIPEDHNTYELHRTQLLATGRSHGCELRVIRQGGSPFWTRMTATAARDAESGLTVYRTLVANITDLKQAEDALRRSEERYRMLLDGSMDAVFVHFLDEQGMPGRFIQVNDVACGRLGYSREELLQMTPLDIAAPESSGNRQKIAEDLRNRGTSLFETVHLTRDGRRIAVESHIRLLTIDNRSAVLSTCRDITNRKQAEEEKAELEAQNRQLQKAESLGRMAGAIAHNFNNLFQSVIGNLELAFMNLSRGTDPAGHMTESMKAASKAADLSGLMLGYLGQITGKHEPIDLAETCRRGLTMLRAAMPENILLETGLPCPGPVVSANDKQVQQVLTHLFNNARESLIDGQGVIHLTVTTVSPADIPVSRRYPIGWLPEDNSYACVKVADTGCGIGDKDAEKLFDPFFSTKFTGRGLGLPVALGIVRSHGGAVTVKSMPGKGSVFCVFLPVAEQEVISTTDKAVKSRSAEDVRVMLLVEDDEMVRKVAATMLSNMGFTVFQARDGAEAVDVFRQLTDEIQFVLCDLTMPRMNGWETLAALRRIRPGIPVILASGYDEARVMSDNHAERPQAFLGKPYGLSGLKDAIRQALVIRENSGG